MLSELLNMLQSAAASGLIWRLFSSLLCRRRLLWNKSRRVSGFVEKKRKAIASRVPCGDVVASSARCFRCSRSVRKVWGGPVISFFVCLLISAHIKPLHHSEVVLSVSCSVSTKKEYAKKKKKSGSSFMVADVFKWSLFRLHVLKQQELLMRLKC